MISEQGAILIATVYPIALLLLVIDGQRALKVLVHSERPRVKQFMQSCVIGMLWASVFSVMICVFTVSSGRTLDGVWAGIVSVAGFMLLGATTFVMAFLLRGVVRDD